MGALCCGLPERSLLFLNEAKSLLPSVFDTTHFYIASGFWIMSNLYLSHGEIEKARSPAQLAKSMFTLLRASSSTYLQMDFSYFLVGLHLIKILPNL